MIKTKELKILGEFSSFLKQKCELFGFPGWMLTLGQKSRFQKKQKTLPGV
jgi:hypothetical protein